MEAHHDVLKVLNAIEGELIDVKMVPDILQFVTLRAAVEELEGLPIVSLAQSPITGWRRLAKRAIDLGLASLGLVLLAPVLGLVALLIRLTSPGAVFYRQERMGLDGRSFQMYKFRSMVVDAEAESGPVWASEGDERRTLVGRVLRRFSLDELPQLWNVVRGDMSLVGPRPERPYFVQQFKTMIPQYMLRHKVKSGMTGWAQVNGLRGNTSLEKRIEYDLYYIQNWSVALDIKILFLTLYRAWQHRHAH
jgi:Undecaprenyl-phosphate glucose phosphotransferase